MYYLDFNKYAKKLNCLKTNRLFPHIFKLQFSLINTAIRLCQILGWNFVLIVPEYVLNVVHSDCGIPADTYMAIYLFYLFVFVCGQNNVNILCRSFSVIN